MNAWCILHWRISFVVFITIGQQTRPLEGGARWGSLLLSKLVRCVVDSKHNGLIVTGYPIRLTNLQNGLNILLCQAQSRGFPFLFHAPMITF